ncbi:PAS domain-containing hybrid sensor histidine kinase/response regulator [Eilatimonas milleporae]|uniref:histidine kinase n=1 Tax=Eilatimonas milleporae TaxID=911205 RepID=A0A3M0CQG0_9PROT|nr:PAS domain-containing hybrid sensor histidine kinase/response regulator [Eilatimonas milleporae]RMB11784.1 PAS domain S-box-containing protein [Eilatimonas milleporae]
MAEPPFRYRTRTIIPIVCVGAVLSTVLLCLVWPGHDLAVRVAAGLIASAAAVGLTLHSIRAQAQKNIMPETVLGLAQDMLGIGYWYVDPATNHVVWSQGVYAIHARDPSAPPPGMEEAIAYYHPEDRMMVRRHLQRAVKEKAGFRFRLRLIADDGQEKHVLSIASFTKLNGRDLLYGVFQDVSDRVRREQDLVTMQERFAMAQTSMPMGVFDYDIGRDELVWDDAMFEIYGFSRQDFGGRYEDFLGRLHPEDSEQANHRLQSALVDEAGLYNTRFRIVRDDGSQRWIKGCAVIQRDKNGLPLRMVGLNVDVTDAADTEQRLQAALKAAEQASQAKSDFLAVISHELRTPLNGILGNLQLMKRQTGSEDLLGLVDTAEHSGRLLLTHVSDLLDMAAIEADRMKLAPVSFNPAGLLDEAMALFQPLAEQKGLTLSLKTDPHMPPAIVADRHRLRQVIGCLVGNAIKFTEEGTVTVKADFNHFRAATGSVGMTVKVTDTGIGISQDDQRHLFTPFMAADNTLSRRHGGLGLGLSIAKYIAEAMGGDLRCDSRPGEGSAFTFSVDVPVADHWTDSDGREETVRNGHANGHTNGTETTIPRRSLLVAEDVSVNQQLLEKVLVARWGQDVTFVDNGEEAVNLLKERHFDAVLMDIQMPVMDGVTATRKIRAEMPQHSGMPIIAVTANALGEHVKEYLISGLDYCITKPVDWTELQALLQDLDSLADLTARRHQA